MYGASEKYTKTNSSLDILYGGSAKLLAPNSTSILCYEGSGVVGRNTILKMD